MFPLLKQHLAHNVDQVVAYLLLFHESAVANLLEVRPLAGGWLAAAGGRLLTVAASSTGRGRW